LPSEWHRKNSIKWSNAHDIIWPIVPFKSNIEIQHKYGPYQDTGASMGDLEKKYYT
jgi:hypothetical protein